MFDLNPVSTGATAAFLSLVAIVVVTWIGSAAWAGARARDSSTGRRWALYVTGFAVGWLGLSALLASSGILAKHTLPPPALGYLLAMFAVVGGVITSPWGKALAQHATMSALVGFQAFRFPLELVLHQLYIEGALPIQMTYEDQNIDILTGLTAIAVALVAARWSAREHKWVKGLILVWNILGLALLVNVVSVALLSAPSPLRQFDNEPAVTLIFHTPWTWIASVLVASALGGHIILARAMLARWRS